MTPTPETRVVPCEPTREMWAAGGNAVVGYKQRHHDKVVEQIWTAMLAAAPAAPAQEPVAYLYEHDGMVHDADNPASVVPACRRWTQCVEPWNETPLYAAPPAPVAASAVDGRGWSVMNRNGKQWHVVSPCGSWTMQPEGNVTAQDAEAICWAVVRAMNGSPFSPNPVADIPAGDLIVNHVPDADDVAFNLGRWMSAALSDPNVCDEMKADIEAWFEAGSPTPSVNAPRVKALEWVAYWNRTEAKSVFGDYVITPRRDGAFDWRLDGVCSCFASNSDAAKAAAQADFERRVRACLEPGEATHRHIKRGSLYRSLGYGKMQAKGWSYQTHAGPLYYTEKRSVDMAEVAIYVSVDDGSLWVRPREEFEDGRFEALPLPPAAEGQE